MRALVLLRAIRVHHWAKNLLVFVPLVTAHRVLDAPSAIAAFLAFVAFSLAASAVYLVNDIADIEDDRRHATKRHRAIAAGELARGTALAVAFCFLIGAALAAWPLPRQFADFLGLYLVVNLAYSAGLKRVMLLDVFVLTGFYVLRILAGAAAIEVPVSHWLLAFSLFVFLSLALAKRHVELGGSTARANGRAAGRGYAVGDAPMLGVFGAASGYLSILVFALYITSEQVVAVYRSPPMLWFAVPLLLYWLSRVWLLAHRGELDEDPMLFALRDPASYVVAAGIAAAMFAAT